MNKLLLISKNILRLLFRKKSSVLVYILLPIIGILLPLALFSNSQSGTIRVGIVNHDNGVISGHLIEDIQKQERFIITEIKEDNVNTLIAGGKLECALIIPEGFSSSFTEGQAKLIDVVSVQGVAATGWVDNYLKTYLSNTQLLLAGADNDVAVFNTMYEEFQASQTTVEVKSVKNIATNYSITYLGLGMLIQFLLISAGRTASLIITEKKDRTLSRIKCAPVKGFEYISGNVIINVSLVTLQTVLALLLLQNVFHVDIGVSVINMLLVMFPLLIAAVGANMMIVSISKNEKHFGTLSTMFIYPTCLLSGCFWDVEMMPEFMQKLAMFLPQRWALDGIKSLMMGNGLSDILVNVGVLSAFALAFFAVAVYGFNRKQSATA